jgi:hypothetical protein
VLFDEDNYRAYLELVRDELDGIEFMNLREFLDTVDFYDREHTTPAGSARLSDEVIRRMRTGILHQAEREAARRGQDFAKGGAVR